LDLGRVVIGETSPDRIPAPVTCGHARDGQTSDLGPVGYAQAVRHAFEPARIVELPEDALAVSQLEILGTVKAGTYQRGQEFSFDTAPAPVTLARQTGGDVERGPGEYVPGSRPQVLLVNKPQYESLLENKSVRERYMNRHETSH
jgi:hypothetical protein